MRDLPGTANDAMGGRVPFIPSACKPATEPAPEQLASARSRLMCVQMSRLGNFPHSAARMNGSRASFISPARPIRYRNGPGTLRCIPTNLRRAAIIVFLTFKLLYFNTLYRQYALYPQRKKSLNSSACTVRGPDEIWKVNQS